MFERTFKDGNNFFRRHQQHRQTANNRPGTLAIEQVDVLQARRVHPEHARLGERPLEHPREILFVLDEREAFLRDPVSDQRTGEYPGPRAQLDDRSACGGDLGSDCVGQRRARRPDGADAQRIGKPAKKKGKVGHDLVSVSNRGEGQTAV